MISSSSSSLVAAMSCSPGRELGDGHTVHRIPPIALFVHAERSIAKVSICILAVTRIRQRTIRLSSLQTIRTSHSTQPCAEILCLFFSRCHWIALEAWRPIGHHEALGDAFDETLAELGLFL